MTEMLGYQIRNPFLWEKEIRAVPLAFGVLRPPAELASFRVSVRPPPPPSVPLLTPASAKKLSDVVVVVVESLRRDMVVQDIMPRLSSFAREAWTFDHAITAGNVTHYSWYGLMCGAYPLFFEDAKHSATQDGSLALRMFRQLGYRIQLFATPDTAYQNLESVVFGSRAKLLDSKFHPSERVPAERDRIVVNEVSRALKQEKAGANLYIVALDSTHFDYAWGSGFQPPFHPFATDTAITRDYEHDTRSRIALFNRYKNAVAWMDSLLGQILDALQETGRMGDTILVITGDHGEAFWEHGSGTHGSDLGAEQVEVGFAMRLPGEQPRHFDAVISLMDVMPTVLASLGVDSTQVLAGIPVQARARDSSPMIASRTALTFQGWNSQAFRFALTTDNQRVLLELNRPNPLNANRLSFKDVTPIHGDGVIDTYDRGSPDAYHDMIRGLPQLMDSLPFLSF